MITIRPHHLIDIIRNIGQGRSNVPHPYGHAQHVITRAIFNGAEREFMLVARADDLCKPCIHLSQKGICDDLLSQLEEPVKKQDYNDALDRRLFEFFGLQEGTVVSLDEFLGFIESRFEELVPICLHPKEDMTGRRGGLRKGLEKLRRYPGRTVELI